MLIEAYPGSERITEPTGGLPLHFVFYYGTADTVEYLYKLTLGCYQSCNNRYGSYPIHLAIIGLSERNNPTFAQKIVRYLLDCDPNVKLQKHQHQRGSLLHYACRLGYVDSNIIDAALEMIRVIFTMHAQKLLKVIVLRLISNAITNKCKHSSTVRQTMLVKPKISV